MDFKNIKYIHVVGTSGSGKSTFAKKLSEVLQIPYIEMDQLFWGANWQMPDKSEFALRVEQALEKDKWVLDGNYKGPRTIAWEKVEMVIWLDYSFSLTFYRVLKRTFYRSISKLELWPGTGNRESLYKAFFRKDSILLWVLKTYFRRKIEYPRMMNDPQYSRIHFVRLRRPREAEIILRELSVATSRITIDKKDADLR
jgi:adenylate kinase family enzyme